MHRKASSMPIMYYLITNALYMLFSVFIRSFLSSWHHWQQKEYTIVSFVSHNLRWNSFFLHVVFKNRFKKDNYIRIYLDNVRFSCIRGKYNINYLTCYNNVLYSILLHVLNFTQCLEELILVVCILQSNYQMGILLNYKSLNC